MSVTHKISRGVIKIANSMVNMVVLMIFLFMLAFGCYALWDSNTVTDSAAAAQYEIYKPKEDAAFFQELQSINPDVFGWLTVYGTPIDYPLVQGEDNSKYINTSPEGKESLTGSIFLHYNNDKGFRDFNSIIYGHNMVPQVMFGSVKEFKDKTFFDSHKYGNLYYNSKNHGLELFAIIEADAYDGIIFSPGIEGIDKQQQYLEQLMLGAVQYRDIHITTDDRIVLLSTCSPDSTNGRDILLGRISDEVYKNEYDVAGEKKESASVDGQNINDIWEILPLWGWVLIVLFLLLALLAITNRIRRKRRTKERNK